MKRTTRPRALLTLTLLLSLTTADGLSQPAPTVAGTALEVAEAERSFARRSVEIGWREAFLEFFTDDAVSYAPAPGNARERLLKRPPTPQPQKVVLDWWPVYADASRSGDMGLSTGPSVAYENTPERKEVYHGYYFSVWKRQPGGAWKVVIDVGVETPPPAPADADRARLRTPAPPGREPRRNAKDSPNAGRDDAAAARREVLDLERKLAGRFAGGKVAAAYGELLGDDARLHRDGILPLEGRAAVVAHLSDEAAGLTWRPASSDASRAGDFAYTYGAYEFTARDKSVERGYYLHVWRRDARGRWQLAADVMHPAPVK